MITGAPREAAQDTTTPAARNIAAPGNQPAVPVLPGTATVETRCPDVRCRCPESVCCGVTNTVVVEDGAQHRPGPQQESR